MEFYKETRFKETEIGEIPEAWVVTKLNDENKKVAEIIMGQSPPGKTYNDIGNGVVFLQGNAEFGDIHPKPTMYTTGPIKIAEKNDVLISVRAPVGEVNLSPFKCCIGRGLAAIRCNIQSLDFKFVFYYLKQSLRGFQIVAAGSTFGAIKKANLSSFLIPLPSLPEQQKIASVLSAVDEAIQKTNEIIQKTQKLKKGLMQELLTRGIGHKEFKESEIGRIPKEWEVVEIGSIALEVYRYPTYYNIQYVDTGIPEIRGELIKETGELEKDMKNYRYISPEASERFPKTILREGDFVMSVRATMGKIAMVPKSLEGANITANLMRISLNRSKCYTPFFKQVFLSRKFQKVINFSSSQTTIKTIQAPVLKSIKLPLPPLLEQQKIASILSSVDQKIEKERRTKEQFERLKKGLMQILLTGKVRVKVD